MSSEDEDKLYERWKRHGIGRDTETEPIVFTLSEILSLFAIVSAFLEERFSVGELIEKLEVPDVRYVKSIFDDVQVINLKLRLAMQNLEHLEDEPE